MRGHGIEVYYTGEELKDDGASLKGAIPVAFIDTYYWLDKPAKRVKIDIVKPESAIFINCQPRGSIIVSELKKELSRLIQSRTFPREFGEYFLSHINA